MNAERHNDVTGQDRPPDSRTPGEEQPRRPQTGGNDRPPDPRAAGSARGHAVRIANAASGLAILITAVAVGAAGALMSGLGEREAAYYGPAWVAILVGIGPVYWALFLLLKRARGRAGLPSVEAKRPPAVRVALLGLAVALYLALFGAAVILFGGRGMDGLLLILPFGVLFGGVWLVRGCLAREWEDAIVGVGIAAVSVLPVVHGAVTPEVWLVLAAACFAVSGGVKHLRWRRWVRRLPMGGEDTSAREVLS